MVKSHEGGPYPMGQVPPSKNRPRPQHEPVPPKELLRKTPAMLNHLSAVLLGALALVASTSQTQREHVPKQETTQSMPVPESAGVDTKRFEQVALDLQKRARALHDSSATKDSPLFKEGLDVKQRCRLTSDWFLQEDERLELVWQYLLAHKKRWPQEVNQSFEAIHKEIASVPWPKSAALPGSQSQLERKGTEILGGKQPLKCGFMLNFITQDDVHKAQRIGILLMDAIAQFILADLAREERQVEAARIGEVMIKALDSVVKEPMDR